MQRLIFAAGDYVDGTGREVYSTDGDGVVFLGDIHPGAFDSVPTSDFISGSFPDEVLVNLFDGDRDRLWRTDGTLSGTRPIANSANPDTPEAQIGDRFFYRALVPDPDDPGGAADTALFASDGTEGGTERVAGLPPGVDWLGRYGDDLLVKVRGDGDADDTLYRVSGEDLSVVPLAQLRDPPTPPLTRDGPLPDARLGDILFFGRDEPATGSELWVTEATPGNARLLKDINAGPEDSRPGTPTVLGERVFFSADDGGDRELWVSDGTAAGTERFLDINPGGDSDPTGLTVLQDGRMIFAADDGETGREIWVTDGTRAGTRLLVDAIPGGEGSNPRDFIELGGRIFFTGKAPGGEPFQRELWVTDGTAEGTEQLTELSGTGGFFSSGLVPVDDRVYFIGTDDANGPEIYSHDGSPGGLERETNFPNANGSGVAFLIGVVGAVDDIKTNPNDSIPRGDDDPPDDSPGGSGRDNFMGTRADELFDGEGGKDIVRGRGGEDTLSGGAGDDAVVGGGGDDLLAGGPGNDLVRGSRGADTLSGDGWSDTMRGGNGDDVMSGGNGDDDMEGGRGNDSIDGERGDDTLDGGNRNDTLYGGAGRDVIEGGRGRDAMTGGGGRDTFVFDGPAGLDTIADFALGRDVIDLSAQDITFDEVGIRSIDDGAATRIRHESGWVELEGIAASDVTADLFLF